jgi:IclR family pca regulon transcriptional regulator
VQRDETVASFRKGLDVIKSFGAQHRRQTITDVAERTGLTRAAARRFLLTLCQVGFARTDGKYFELTPAVLEVGQTFLSGMSELEIVRDVLFDLTRRIGESASAAMLDGTDLIYVARSPAPHRILAVGLGVGTRLPAHATSMGHVLLSKLHARELERYFEAAKLDRYTSRTLTTKRELQQRINEVRREGFALVSEELEAGLRSIAVPVPQQAPGSNLAINMSAHAFRVSEEEMLTNFLPALREAAGTISMAVART